MLMLRLKNGVSAIERGKKRREWHWPTVKDCVVDDRIMTPRKPTNHFSHCRNIFRKTKRYLFWKTMLLFGQPHVADCFAQHLPPRAINFNSIENSHCSILVQCLTPHPLKMNRLFGASVDSSMKLTWIFQWTL